MSDSFSVEAQAEIDRLTHQLHIVSRKAEILSNHIDRLGFCPDCRDKVLDRGCLRCELQRKDSYIKRLKDALQDCAGGLKYIRDEHGDIYGVGFDRALNKANAFLQK